MGIFKQNDFSGGMDQQFDASKIADNAFPLLVSGRTRRNTVSLVPKHVQLAAPLGKKQGLYAAGDYLVLFNDGVAHYADVTKSPISFRTVSNWVTMDTTINRIMAELVAATNDFNNRSGILEDTTKTFNGTIKQFPQALFVFDGINQPQAVLPNGDSHVLQTYAQWTKDNPEYVPVAILPAFAANKLFCVSPDGQRIFSSFSGRACDFVINVDPAGNKAGDAETLHAAVGFNKITLLRGVSSGQVLVGTLYGTFILDLDYDHPQFGEPYLRPTFLFPTGPVNYLSIVDILEDTALVTLTGIHSFNAVEQAQRESNNEPTLGARIRGLLVNPQLDPCTALFDDYGLFALNTVHGYGVVLYDTTTKTYQALDLSFGRVKQFATTRTLGHERLFYIDENNVYEAFAATEKEAARIQLGDWTSGNGMEGVAGRLVVANFNNVKSPGSLRWTFYVDGKVHDRIVIQCAMPTVTDNLPTPIPYVSRLTTFNPSWNFANVAKGTRASMMLEWDFDGELVLVDSDGELFDARATMEKQDATTAKEVVAVIGESGYIDEKNPGGNFDSTNMTILNVNKGQRYVYVANGNGICLNGDEQIAQGIFTAKGTKVFINGNGPRTFSLRTAENYMKVLDRIDEEKQLDGIIHAGNFAYPAGSFVDVTAALLGIRRRPFCPVGGSIDQNTDYGESFYNFTYTKRYYVKEFQHFAVFFYDGDNRQKDGTGADSIQAAILANYLNATDKPHVFVVVPQAPYTNDATLNGGRDDLRFLGALNISAVISAGGRALERIVDINATSHYVTGSAGQSSRGLSSFHTAAFSTTGTLGFLRITADPLTAIFEFVDSDGNLLDTSAVYAIRRS